VRDVPVWRLCHVAHCYSSARLGVPAGEERGDRADIRAGPGGPLVAVDAHVAAPGHPFRSIRREPRSPRPPRHRP
jgi:hypothetical protein